MIDFRYHIVSLISVFLALAVGIALGAGPLKEQIGDTLTGQVQQLRTEKDALRTELDGANSDLKDSRAFLTAAAPGLVTGKLADRRVAIVVLGETDQAIIDGISAELTAAGATVSAQVQVSDNWTSKAKGTFRQSLAGGLVTYLNPAPAQNASSDIELAEALAQSLTGTSSSDPNALSESASIMLQLLTKGELVTTTADVTAPADAIVIVAGPMSMTETTTATPPSDDVTAAELALATAAQVRSRGAVVVGGVATEPGLVKAILANKDASGRLTTVADGLEVTGQITVPLALNARIGGVNGHYGVGTDLTPIPTTVNLPAVSRAPQPASTGSGG